MSAGIIHFVSETLPTFAWQCYVANRTLGLSPGNRLIFLNVPLLDFEQRALRSLHDALKDEKARKSLCPYTNTHTHR